METLAGIVEILRNIVVWLLGRRERKQQHLEAIEEAERELDDAVNNGNTIGELSEAVENLKRRHSNN